MKVSLIRAGARVSMLQMESGIESSNKYEVTKEDVECAWNIVQISMHAFKQFKVGKEKRCVRYQ